MGKLVRDKIDEIIIKNGETPVTRILSDEDYKKELLKKLDEEFSELKEAIVLKDKNKICEESADLFEVIKAYNELYENSFDDIVNVMKEKREKRGGFSRKLYLEKTK